MTVTGRDDYYDEDNVTYIVSLSVEAASTQDEYDSIVPDNVTLVNIDNDTSGFVYGNISDNISENGSISIFTVRLDSRPFGFGKSGDYSFQFRCF